MSEKIVVCLEKGGARDMAEAFSRRTNTPIAEKPGEHLTVLFNSKGVSLTGYGLTYSMKCWYGLPNQKSQGARR